MAKTCVSAIRKNYSRKKRKRIERILQQQQQQQQQKEIKHKHFIIGYVKKCKTRGFEETKGERELDTGR